MNTSRLHLIIYDRAALLCGIILSLLPLATSCEHEIPYNVESKEPVLILNALLHTGEEEDYVVLHLGEATDVGRLEEATLTCYVNGRKTETLQPLTDKEAYGDPESYPPYLRDYISQYLRHKLFRLHTPLQPGDHIRLEATAEGGKYHAAAEATAPQPATLLQVDTCAAYLHEANGKSLYRRYDISLQDRPGEKNFYRLAIDNDYHYRYSRKKYQEDGSYVWQDTIVTQRHSQLINREDVILTDGQPQSYDDEENGLFPTIKNSYNIFTDSRFPNSSATLKVYTEYKATSYAGNIILSDYQHVYRQHTITVHLFSLTETEYRYFKALNCLQDGNYDESLMEPIIFPSNVEGGLGFVSISTESLIRMELPEEELLGGILTENDE